MGTLGSGSSSMTCSMTSSSSSGSYGGPNWWCTVGKPLDNGTFTWCCPVSLNLNNPNGVGHVRKRSDGVVEFTWMDNFSNINILRGRGISLNGTGIWQ